MSTTEGQASEAQQGVVYAQVVEDLRAALTTDEIASVVGASGRQVQNWAAGKNKPQGPGRELLLDVAYIVDRLSDIYHHEGVEIWLHGRNRLFGGQRPLDLLREGDFKTVLNAVERLTEGTPT